MTTRCPSRTGPACGDPRLSAANCVTTASTPTSAIVRITGHGMTRKTTKTDTGQRTPGSNMALQCRCTDDGRGRTASLQLRLSRAS